MTIARNYKRIESMEEYKKYHEVLRKAGDQSYSWCLLIDIDYSLEQFEVAKDDYDRTTELTEILICFHHFKDVHRLNLIPFRYKHLEAVRIRVKFGRLLGKVISINNRIVKYSLFRRRIIGIGNYRIKNKFWSGVPISIGRLPIKEYPPDHMQDYEGWIPKKERKRHSDYFVKTHELHCPYSNKQFLEFRNKGIRCAARCTLARHNCGRFFRNLKLRRAGCPNPRGKGIIFRNPCWCKFRSGEWEIMYHTDNTYLT